MTVPWWVFSRLFFMFGSINLILTALVGTEVDSAVCSFLMAICAQLYAQEDGGNS